MNETAKSLDSQTLELAFESLAIRLAANGVSPVEIVVCGGSALIVTGLVMRTTQDVDIVALLRDGTLCSPAPLPASLLQAATEVAEDLDLDSGWLNNGPSRGQGGLFQMGLPEGLVQRLRTRKIASTLTVHFIGRVDQIHFKLYASVDRGGYHIDDLRALSPSHDELESAARWAMSHDVSDGFAMILKGLLRKLGYEEVARRL